MTGLINRLSDNFLFVGDIHYILIETLSLYRICHVSLITMLTALGFGHTFLNYKDMVVIRGHDT